ncbi:short chain dehydrogenase [Delitschia confertaspora ATCC 74209]|uniref:Short chain dehydrogenase n=1 Tax=Delitschia confertaspora ATCC 74209 TaxID=1513339 RepID=A0A9P4JPH2_9PLEO|nr:short chain dehydrogenase [Delitschia confertaspora ATCC 74209]
MSSEKTIILITGANSGIGYDTASALVAASPTNHVIMGCRSLPKGTQALAELRAKNLQGTLSLLELDVTSDTSISAAASQIEKDFGKLDVLINNAGIVVQDPPNSITPRERVQRTFETNTFGPMILTTVLVPLLQKSSNPRIINVSSSLGSITLKNDPSWLFYASPPADEYRMSKAALNMLSGCFRQRFEQWGCKVWSYCPGYVVTNLTGEGDRQRRKESGADSSEVSAKGIRDIVEGKRDHEVGQFVEKDGGTFLW